MAQKIADFQQQATERYVMPLNLTRSKLQHEDGTPLRREYEVQFISAGHVKARDGTDAPWEIPAETVQQAVKLLKPTKSGKGVSVNVDHPGDGFFGSDNASVRDIAGVITSARFDADSESAVGRIRLSSRPDMEWLSVLMDELLADQVAGEPVPDLGGSLVFWGRHDYVDVGQEPGEEFMRVTKEITHIESWDIVFGPGAEGRIKNALSKVVGNRPNKLTGGKTMNFCAECGSSLKDGACPQCKTTLAVQETLATAPAAQPVDVTPAATENGTQESGESKPNEALTSLNDNLMELQQVITSKRAEKEAQMLTDLAERFDGVLNVLTSQSKGETVTGFGTAPTDHRLHGIITQRDQLEAFSENVDWLFGVENAKLPDPEFRRADMMYVALTGDYEFSGVFQSERVKLASANSTTLANMAVDAMNKVIAVQFSALRYWRWYEAVSSVAPNDGSLQDVKWITFGGVTNLPIISEGGAYGELEVDDVRETDAFNKHGAFVGISREMIKNSEISRIQGIPRALANASVRTRSAAISSLFTSNSGVGPTLDQDSTALFHSDHSNVQTTAFGADTTAWQAASLECFNHTEVQSGKKLGVFPRYALVPADLYVGAKTVFGYGEGMPTTYAPYSVEDGLEDPRPIPLVVPDWTDATDWAYVVDPRAYPVIHMSYSQAPGGGSHPAPELFLVISESAGLVFTNDTLPIKVRDEFAFGVNGARGIGKRNVA